MSQTKPYDWALLQPTSDHEDLAAIERGIGERYGGRFLLVGYKVDDWDVDLSPWPAPPVFGDRPFGSGAEATLRRLVASELPRCREVADRVCIGGYSMAGLFSLYAGIMHGAFDAVCAVSPSVWFPGWVDFAQEHPLQVPRAYISLGDREHRSRHQLIRRVRDCVQRQYDLFPCERRLDWNEGTHFTDPAARMAKGYLWVMDSKTVARPAVPLPPVPTAR